RIPHGRHRERRARPLGRLPCCTQGRAALAGSAKLTQHARRRRASLTTLLGKHVAQTEHRCPLHTARESRWPCVVHLVHSMSSFACAKVKIAWRPAARVSQDRNPSREP